MSEAGKIIINNALTFAKVLYGWDKNDLAKEMGVRVTTLNSVKNGTRGAGAGLINKMAAAIRIDVATLLRGSLDGNEKKGEFCGIVTRYSKNGHAYRIKTEGRVIYVAF